MNELEMDSIGDETVEPDLLAMPVEAMKTLCWIVVEGDCRFLHLSFHSLWENICLWDLHVLYKTCTSKAE